LIATGGKSMRPIEERVDLIFWQALKCVEYRIPREPCLKRPGALLSLGLRYGLMGAAAAHYLILTSTESESEELGALFFEWPAMVEDHVRWEIRHRLPFPSSEAMPVLLGRLAKKPLQIHLSQHPELVPVGRCLEIVVEEFTREHEATIVAGWNVFSRKKARRAFHKTSQESLTFAKRFYERRECGIDEIPEIALIGD
jgi:hypothetical protein